MFADRWPSYPEEEVPVSAVTNGIHTTTWVSRRMAALFDEHLGADWRRNPQEKETWAPVANIPDEDLWGALENQRGELIRYIRRRLQKDLERRTMNKPEFGMINGILDPRILTIGFARRFATYKRASLMLTDRERLMQILFHPERPVQIVIAGKSHPRDDGGKHIIQDLMGFINTSGARARMVFLEDYDMGVARALVQGVDLWLNNPRRPYEASGTSGMKVVPNGGLNCSILDGWWDEGYEPGTGWAISDRSELADTGHQDWLDSRALYHLLETEITPIFYHRVDNGVPKGWVQMVKNSIMNHAPEFSTSRMVRDYAVGSYMPAAKSYHSFAEDDLSRAKSALEWRDRVQSSWSQVRVAWVKDSAGISNSLGKEFCLQAGVDLNGLDPKDVDVQAIIGRIGPNREIVDAQVVSMEYKSTDNGVLLFEGSLVCNSAGHQGYTVRVIPKHADINVAHELTLVAWE